jgi:DNA-binding XRE family transcriptional regulator
MDLKLLQKNVADMIAVSECTVYNWENGGSQPETKYMPGIIDFLGYVPFECPEDILGRLAYFKRIKGLTFPGLGEVMGRDHEQLWDWLSCQKRPCRRNLESINEFLAKHGLGVEIRVYAGQAL